MNQNELMHYGVLGMKWGVRRYQNEDGSYKPGAEGRYTDKVKAMQSSYTKATNRNIKDMRTEKREIRKDFRKGNITKTERNSKINDAEQKTIRKNKNEFDKLIKNQNDLAKNTSYEEMTKQALADAGKGVLLGLSGTVLNAYANSISNDSLRLGAKYAAAYLQGYGYTSAVMSLAVGESNKNYKRSLGD